MPPAFGHRGDDGGPELAVLGGLGERDSLELVVRGMTFSLNIHLRITGADQADSAVNGLASVIAALGSSSPLHTDQL